MILFSRPFSIKPMSVPSITESTPSGPRFHEKRIWSPKPSGVPQRKAKARKTLLHALDQLGHTAVAVTLHDRVAVADILGERRFNQAGAACCVGFVPGIDVVPGDGVEVSHGLVPFRF